MGPALVKQLRFIISLCFDPESLINENLEALIVAMKFAFPLLKYSLIIISSQHLPNMEKVWSFEESFTPETCLVTRNNDTNRDTLGGEHLREVLL